ncbi:hypothetical protein MIND_01350000 [Mycena indigotica]|uniref:Uncharacterized protein n=1 Tax=Mycena indigotica TaxID=2126181 RepID=A0A8H6RZX4_9AGAR|nr:uncharacterized protein MIND_01350000 [Mycena indigotica]KAF7289763.1 hypothetical protein MIND_01350000 [Mycena indigotica]
MAATQLSLFTELTRLTQPGYPVTEVLTKLLNLVGHDVCATKRNHHAVYWAVSQARDIIDGINALVKVAGEGESWEAFDDYTIRILWIEKVLLAFSLITEKETIVARFGETSSIVEEIAFVDALRDNRKDLRDILQQLIDSTYLKGDVAEHTKAVKTVQKQDDLSAFRATVGRLRNYLNRLSGHGKDSLAEVVRRFDALHVTLATAPDTLADAVFLFALQCALLIEIVTSNRDKKAFMRVQDKEFWRTVLGWITVAEKHAKDPNFSVTGLPGEYTAAVIYLTGAIVAQLPDGFKDLRPLVALTRRPFYSQSVTIVAGCAELATTFNKQKTVEMLSAFNAALEKATSALKAAADVKYDPYTPWATSDSATAAFEEAETAIKFCYQDYQVSSATWEKRMKNSRDSDADRLAQLEKRFSRAKTDFPAEQTIDVTVSVSLAGSQTQPIRRSYKIDSALTLHALLWKEASLRESIPAANEVRNQAFFYATADKAPLDLDMLISNLPNAQGRSGKVVVLVVPNV